MSGVENEETHGDQVFYRATGAHGDNTHEIPIVACRACGVLRTKDKQCRCPEHEVWETGIILHVDKKEYEARQQRAH